MLGSTMTTACTVKVLRNAAYSVSITTISKVMASCRELTPVSVATKAMVRAFDRVGCDEPAPCDWTCSPDSTTSVPTSSLRLTNSLGECSTESGEHACLISFSVMTNEQFRGTINNVRKNERNDQHMLDVHAFDSESSTRVERQAQNKVAGDDWGVINSLSRLDRRQMQREAQPERKKSGSPMWFPSAPRRVP